MPTAPRGLIQGEWTSQPGVSRRSRSISQPLQLTTCQDRQSTCAAGAICLPTDLFRELAAPSTFSIPHRASRSFLLTAPATLHSRRLTPPPTAPLIPTPAT